MLADEGTGNRGRNRSKFTPNLLGSQWLRIPHFQLALPSARVHQQHRFGPAKSRAKCRPRLGRPRLLLLDGSLDGLDLDSCPELLDTLFDPAAPWTLVLVTARHDIRSRCGRIVKWS